MRSFRSLAMGALLLASSAALTTALTTPANADPTCPATVAASDITAVGSDTIQFLGNNLSCGPGLWTSQHPNQKLDSWDAVNPSTGATHDPIMIKPGITIQRPNGSSEGIQALIANSAVDVARASRGPQANDSTSTGPLQFIPFATDGLSYASSKQVPTNVPDGLTQADLTSIYNCTKTNWDQFGGPNAPIHALLPQTGSGTRAFFLQQLGLSDPPPGGCTISVEEHDPAPIENDPDAIAPFSDARFVFPADLSNQIQLNGTGFFAERLVYFVTRNSGVASNPVPGNLQALVGDGSGNGTGFLCSPAAQNEAANEGFGPTSDLGVPCGQAAHI